MVRNKRIEKEWIKFINGLKPKEPEMKVQALETKHKFKEDGQRLSDSGIQQVAFYLRTHIVSLRYFHMDEGVLDWTTRLTQDGRLVTRISRHVYKNWEVKLDKDAKAQVGNIINQYKVPSKEYIFEFDPNISGMVSGRFGDDGSCFYTENKEARWLMQANDFHVIKIYTQPNEEPHARAWCKWLDGESFVMFNGYGMQTRTVATLLSRALDMVRTPIKLTNLGKGDNLLWINDKVGYLLGKNALIEERAGRPWYDFNIPHDDDCECRYCRMDEDDY